MGLCVCCLYVFIFFGFPFSRFCVLPEHWSFHPKVSKKETARSWERTFYAQNSHSQKNIRWFCVHVQWIGSVHPELRVDIRCILTSLTDKLKMFYHVFTRMSPSPTLNGTTMNGTSQVDSILDVKGFGPQLVDLACCPLWERCALFWLRLIRGCVQL